MNHVSIFDQAYCDVIRQCDEEVFSGICNFPWKSSDDVESCSACGGLVCCACNKHIDGEPCPVSIVDVIMES